MGRRGKSRLGKPWASLSSRLYPWRIGRKNSSEIRDMWIFKTRSYINLAAVLSIGIIDSHIPESVGWSAMWRRRHKKTVLATNEAMIIRLFSDGSVEIHVRKGLDPKWIRTALEPVSKLLGRTQEHESNVVPADSP